MKLDSRQLLQELKDGLGWPVYWIHGTESWRVREACAALSRAWVGGRSWAEDRLDGGSCSAEDVVASAQSIPLGGGARVVWVRDAHLIRDAEALAGLLGPRGPGAELPWICIFTARDLDGRKKISKLLLEKAAVLACEEVPEEQRESWVSHLARARGLDVGRLPMELLCRFEPWSLDWVQNELEKWDLSEAAEAGSGSQVLLGGDAGSAGVSDRFTEAFLEQRSLSRALLELDSLVAQPEQALPLLGLLAWNVRMMGLLLARSRSLRLSPFLENRLRRAVARWTLPELRALQAALAELDFAVKQTPQEPLALWGVLVHQFCRSSAV
jgi:DNA polymerase III delta subunit